MVGAVPGRAPDGRRSGEWLQNARVQPEATPQQRRGPERQVRGVRALHGAIRTPRGACHGSSTRRWLEGRPRVCLSRARASVCCSVIVFLETLIFIYFEESKASKNYTLYASFNYIAY